MCFRFVAQNNVKENKTKTKIDVFSHFSFVRQKKKKKKPKTNTIFFIIFSKAVNSGG